MRRPSDTPHAACLGPIEDRPAHVRPRQAPAAPIGPGLQWSNLRPYVHDLLSPIVCSVLRPPLVPPVARVFVLIVGAGRVGSAVAKLALAAGHEVSVLDEDPLSHERLDAGQSKSWEESGGQFTVGTALETDALIQAGIERADAFIASTAGDNTNLVIAQLAQKRFGVEKAIVRVMDPARADWYGEQGLQTISPTKHAIDMFQRALASEAA